MRPYADNTFYIIAMKKGWFKDVGIKIEPEALWPEGQRHQRHGTAPQRTARHHLGVLPADAADLQDAKKLKCIAFTDNFLGNAILANPKLKLKTFKDYIGEGKSFDEAIKAALAPMKGKTLVGAPELSDRPFEEAAARWRTSSGSCRCWTTPSRWCWPRPAEIDFVNPEGAPIVYTLGRRAGPISSTSTTSIKHGPGGVDSPVEPLVASSASAPMPTTSTRNPNTVLRFLSVVWRIIDAMKKDASLYDLQAPYLNSVAGTSLDGKGVAATVDPASVRTLRLRQDVLRRQGSTPITTTPGTR